MKHQVEFTKEDGTLIYGDSYGADINSPQHSYFSKTTVQDMEELRKAMIKYDFTTKDFKSWSIINI